METAGKAKEKRIFSCDCWVVSDMVYFHDSFPFTKSNLENFGGKIGQIDSFV